MPHEVVLPKLGVSINEGKIVQWLKREGEAVSAGETLFVVETEKTTVDVEANVSGKLARILYPEGTTLKAGKIIAIVTEPSEELSQTELDAIIAQINPERTEQIGSDEPVEVQRVLTDKRESIETRASPAARRLMRERGINPSSIVGTGPAGTITLKDVTESDPKGMSDFSVASLVPLTGTRLTIAQKLSKSHSEAVHVTLTTDVDATALEKWRSKQPLESKPSLTEALIPLVVQALKDNPRLNAVFEEDAIKEIRNINVGVAVDTPDGLKVPVLKNADKMILSAIVSELRLLKDKAIKGKLSPDEVSEGTFTVTNLGMYGIQAFTPIINSPQCAILGVGAIEETPSVREGTIVVRKMMTLSLSFDHRVMDGVTASKFLKSMSDLINGANSV